MAKAKNFNLTSLLSQRSRDMEEEKALLTGEALPSAAEVEKGTPGTADIYDLIPSKGNFYGVEDVADLKQSIELLGVLQPLLVTEPQRDGKRRIKAGHRRRLAVLQLVEEGKDQFRYVPILERVESNTILDRLALIMANRFREKTDWERMTEAIETENLVLQLKETVDIPGRTRDLLAEIIETSPAQVGRYKAIYNNLAPELMAEFKANKIGISVIYEVSGLSEGYQKQAAELFRENDVLTLSDIKQLKKAEEAERQIPGQMEFIEEGKPQELGQQDTTDAMEDMETEEDEEEGKEDVESQQEGTEEATEPQEEFEPRPEYAQSLCYTCKHYKECHVKTATVNQCETYQNRKEAFKTDEQRYNEEQAAIDRETARKLKEQAQEEKMQQLPSDAEPKQHNVTLSPDKYESIRINRLTFLLLRKDGYKVGEEITLPEYKGGKGTGRTVDIKIIYVCQDWTGLEDDYCIIGFDVTEYEV